MTLTPPDDIDLDEETIALIRATEALGECYGNANLRAMLDQITADIEKAVEEMQRRTKDAA